MKKQDVIPKANVLRIGDAEMLAKLNEDYAKKRSTLDLSRNAYLNEVLSVGIDVITKQNKDDWAIKNETTTLLDAIHEHTKRMNFFVKFSQPFIKKSYANLEVIEQMLSVWFNYMVVKMDATEKRLFFQDLSKYAKLPEDFAEVKTELQKYYDYRTE